MEKKKVAPHALAAGIVFALMAVVLMVDLISEGYPLYSFICFRPLDM